MRYRLCSKIILLLGCFLLIHPVYSMDWDILSLFGKDTASRRDIIKNQKEIVIDITRYYDELSESKDFEERLAKFGKGDPRKSRGIKKLKDIPEMYANKLTSTIITNTSEDRASYFTDQQDDLLMLVGRVINMERSIEVLSLLERDLQQKIDNREIKQEEINQMSFYISRTYDAIRLATGGDSNIRDEIQRQVELATNNLDSALLLGEDADELKSSYSYIISSLIVLKAMYSSIEEFLINIAEKDQFMIKIIEQAVIYKKLFYEQNKN